MVDCWSQLCCKALCCTHFCPLAINYVEPKAPVLRRLLRRVFFNTAPQLVMCHHTLNVAFTMLRQTVQRSGLLVSLFATAGCLVIVVATHGCWQPHHWCWMGSLALHGTCWSLQWSPQGWLQSWPTLACRGCREVFRWFSLLGIEREQCCSPPGSGAHASVGESCSTSLLLPEADCSRSACLSTLELM